MRLEIEEPAGSDLSVLTITEESGRWAALCCSSKGPENRGRLLMPARLHAGGRDLASSPSVRAEIVRQTRNLSRKIAAIDRLRLTETSFAGNFSAARLFVYGDRVDSAEAWEFGRNVLDVLPGVLGRQVISQPDYDQRRLHPHLSGMLESIDFRIKHKPSAIATVVSFHAVLQNIGMAAAATTWLIKGAGAVGSEIIDLLASTSERIYVDERLAERRDVVAGLPSVSLVLDRDVFPVGANAVVFCANSGSLSVDVARALASNGSVVAVGGPEAGLDRSHTAMRTLVMMGKIFVPSVLCGSLGLVSNLEECLGIDPNVGAYARRLESAVAVMAARSDAEQRPFHELCLDVLEGRVSIEALSGR